MSVARLHALIDQVEAAVEFDDLGSLWRDYRKGPDGRPLLMLFWVRGRRRLAVRLYPRRTTVEVSTYTHIRKPRAVAEVLIKPGHDFLMVLRRGVDWLRSEAPPREFDPGCKATTIVPDFDEVP